jgi:hypothetical protein
MRTLRTREKAAYLHVSSDTRRLRERQSGILSASSIVRETHDVDARRLASAPVACDGELADGAREHALSVVSPEHAVDRFMLPGFDEVADRHGLARTPWAYGARRAVEWLARAERLALRTYRRPCGAAQDLRALPARPTGASEELAPRRCGVSERSQAELTAKLPTNSGAPCGAGALAYARPDVSA